jgi:hypothetical protein
MTYSAKEAQSKAVSRLDMFINEISAMPRFRGQTQMLRELRRIKTRSYLR